MIPKIIHYCWFGGNPLPKDALYCINSWKTNCPDYEIIQWNESNIDYSDCEYATEAYKQKKWAFVSDYVRFKVLYDYGGLYFDTDVEVIKPIDHIVSMGSFMACENSCDQINDNQQTGLKVAPGLGIGAEPKLELYKEIIDMYKSIHFVLPEKEENIDTVVEHISRLLRLHGLIDTNEIQKVDNIYIYPKEYFNPMDLSNGKITVSNNTVSIHHYNGSWLDANGKRRGRLFLLLKRVFGDDFAEHVRKQYREFKRK